jgi:hypothetical protein
MDKSLDEAPERSDHNPDARDGIAIEAVKLHKQVCKGLEAGNAEERANRRQRDTTRTIDTAREGKSKRVSSLCIVGL